MPAQPTTTLHDQEGAALGAARRSRDRRAARAGDQDLAGAAAVPIHGDPLATQLVRECVRSFDVGSRRVAAQVDGLADGGVDVALEGSLHLDVRGDVDLVSGWEDALDIFGDVSPVLQT